MPERGCVLRAATNVKVFQAPNRRTNFSRPYVIDDGHLACVAAYGVDILAPVDDQPNLEPLNDIDALPTFFKYLKDSYYGGGAGKGLAKLLQETETRLNNDKSSSFFVVLAALFDPGYDNVEIAHVGSCRGYLLRNKQLEQLTVDHTVVNEMVQSKRITSAAARTNPYRHLISRCLGNDCEVDSQKISLQDQDRLFLVTDVLANLLEPEELTRVLVSNAEPLDELHRISLQNNLEENWAAVQISISAG